MWRTASLALALLVSIATGCARPAATPPTALPAAVALLPIDDPPNRSAVTGVFTFAGWLVPAQQAVPNQLAEALTEALAARGIALRRADPTGEAVPDLVGAKSLARQSAGDVPLLWVAVRKWEADVADFPSLVDVAVDAALLAPGTGTPIWTSPTVFGPVATLGSTSLGAAYGRAAGAVADRLVAAMHPGR